MRLREILPILFLIALGSGFLGAIVGYRSDSSFGDEAACSKVGKVTLLFDRTVDSRGELITESQSVFEDLLKAMLSDSSKYLGSKIELRYLDDFGEHSAAWGVSVPSRYGMQKSDFRRALGELREAALRTINSLKSDLKRYKSSFLVEGVNQVVKSSGPCDRIIVVSDMCAVDASGNNFERLKFNDPPALHAEGRVEIHRIGRARQSLESTELIEAWWNDALYGTSTFAPKYTAYNARRVGPYAQGQSVPSPQREPIKASRGIELANERIIDKRKSSITLCSRLKRGKARKYEFKVQVRYDGIVKSVTTVDSEPDQVSACIEQVLRSSEYVPIAEKAGYYFEPVFTFRRPADT